jgi:branched-chain amino acid transport system ATP-binding protein
MTAALRLDGIAAGYGETAVLRDVSLEVPPGSVVSLLGPNGAGKSTTLGVISGLLRPRAGSVTFGDRDVTHLKPSGRVALGLCHIPDPRGIFGSFTVRENLTLQSAATASPNGVERAVAAFPRLGQRMTQLARTLSGGEQQMLAVARAYVQSPSIVLLDEVSMGLAPNLVDEIFQSLDRLSGDGVTLLIVEQFVHRALAMADRVYVMHRGSIVLEGDASELSEAAIFDAYAGRAGVAHIPT